MSSPRTIRICEVCGCWQSYPRPVCQKCRGRRFRQSADPEPGVIYSITTLHRAASALFQERAPYTIALVEGESGGLLLVPVDHGQRPPEIGDAVHVLLAPDGPWAGETVARTRIDQAP